MRLYQILEIKHTATEQEIKKAYKKLSIKWHPDKNRDNVENATKKFQEINEAYKILQNTKIRKIYDQFGEEAAQKSLENELNGNSGNGFSNSNPFNQFFNNFGFNMGGMGGGMGGMGMGGRNAPQKCTPITHELKVTLKELYTGKKYKFQIKAQKQCTVCDGFGNKTKQNNICNICNGSGKIIRQTRFAGMIQAIQTVCQMCNGTGKIKADESNICDKCNGKEYLMENRVLDFTLIPGMEWSNKIVIQGKGNQLRDKINGDIILVLVEKQDKKLYNNLEFIRKDNQLHLTLDINLYQALTNYNYEFTHFNEKKCTINISEVITPDYVKVIKGWGMPHVNQNYLKQGTKLEDIHKNLIYDDLYIHFRIKFPNNVNDIDSSKLSEIKCLQ